MVRELWCRFLGFRDGTDQIADMQNGGKPLQFNDVIKRAQLQKFRFRLRYKLESYNDETRANATIEKTERLNQSSPKYWEYIAAQSDRIERALNSS